MSRRSQATVGTTAAGHIVAKVSGVKAGDSKVQAAEKVIATMRLAGFAESEIRKSERMLERYKASGGK